jgi:hypothetical protein
LRALLILFFVLTWKIHSFAEENYQFSYNYFDFNTSISLDGRHYDEKNVEKASLIGPHFRLEGKLTLSESTHFIVDGRLIQEFGSSQSRFGENIPTNGIFINNSYFSYSIKRFSLDAGIIDHGWLNNELLFADAPFPTLRARMRIGAAQFFAQIAMPTSTRIKTKTNANEDEPLSWSSGVHWQNTATKWKLLSHLFYYEFHKLPSEVAIDSATFGNTVTVINSSQAEFDHEFKGASGRVRAVRNIDSWSVGGEYKAVKNFEVGSGFGLGQLIGLDLSYLVASQRQTLRAIHFFNESDTTVASYNSYELGHNNREGYGLAILHAFSKQLRGTLAYIESQPINEDFVKNDIQYVRVHLTWNLAPTPSQ